MSNKSSTRDVCSISFVGVLKVVFDIIATWGYLVE
jgi:hypothetical protein